MKHLPEEQREIAERLGLELDYDFNGEAYRTVSGQNANNSVRLPDAFFEAVDQDGAWTLHRRTDGKPARSIMARDLWDQIAFAAWRCADPGLQYDGTINAWHTCPNSGRINASNPCSEYMFLDNTACNLASINLLKFYDAETRTFDVAGYEHAISLWTIVLEISVLMAAYPSKEVAQRSWEFRTLGLGYANLGAMLMQAGIPYDSDEGRAVCAALTAILTGRSYQASAEMAKALGPFPGFAANREAMLRVMRNHRRAAQGAARTSEEYEGLIIRPVPIDHSVFAEGRIGIANASELLERATATWDKAIDLGQTHGYRNAQVTVIAPTGTIGLLMDCDTTGVEPDFALTKFKKLAGGGHFKIANQSLRPALKALGYKPQEVDEIVTYVMGTLSLDTPMPEGARQQGETFREFLESQGYTSEDLIALENQLPTVFELAFAFNAWSMPEPVLVKRGLDVEKARASRSFNGLKAMGLTARQIEALNVAICGTQTVEGAPHLESAHLAVFDCASKCGKRGTRFIRPEGHIRMMAAAQPFISGAISKTINLPMESTVADIAAAYRMSWELGLKANALYRDGSKLSQPLSAKRKDDSAADAEAEAEENALGESSTEAAAGASAISTSPTSSAVPLESACIERIVERIVERPLRRRLPDTRHSLTHRFNVAGHEGYLTVGLYDDGRPGELFITMSKEGSTIGGLMDSLGTAISVALQYGVPIESLVMKFAHQRFEPQGMTSNRDIPFAKSLVDYIFRWMGMEFIPGYREQNAPKRGATAPEIGSVAGMDRGLEARAPRSDDAGPSPRFATETGAVVESISSMRTEQVIVRGGEVAVETTTRLERSVSAAATALDQSNAALMGDAPACEVCGAITIRNATCYKCLNCGNSMGCS
jgi:ribonucleoside-diphosphate reductase alpha chain